MKATYENKLQILLLFLLILLVILLSYDIFEFEILSFMNSHFGSNLSHSESDTDFSKYNNWISRLYKKCIERQKRLLSEDTHLQKQFPPVSSQTVPTVDYHNINPSLFKHLSHHFRSPVIIRGFSKDCTAFKRWNLDYFRRLCGETKLPMINDASLEANRRYMSNGATDYRYIKVKEFIQRIKNGHKSYINNVSRIFGHHPRLIDDLPMEDIRDKLGHDMVNSNNVSHLFFGGSGTATSLHCSFTGNFFYNIRGQKMWYLIHPQYSRYLSPSLSPGGLFAVSQVDVFSENQQLSRIPRYKFVLNEGDLLFNPPWWWHGVKNMSPYTIATANRFASLKVGFQNNPLYTINMLSHPFQNYRFIKDYKQTRQERNLNFDSHLLQDILKQKQRV